MIVHVSASELEEPFKSRPCDLREMYNLSIDYQTNSILGYLNDIEYEVFRFSGYGFVNDNRFNTYELSVGEAGILIEIIKKR